MTQDERCEPLVQWMVEGNRGFLTLNRPQKHNSLVPDLLYALNEKLDHVADIASSLDCLVLQGAGKSFSTGGDVKAFYQQDEGAIAAYSADLVGALNQAIMKVLRLEVPTIARLHGPVTGGAVGLVLACDLVAARHGAFFAPYYVEVGFAPDGGWTALMPDRIGRARARRVQLLNQHIEAAEALEWGLIDAVAEDEAALDDIIKAWGKTLGSKVRGSIDVTRQLLRSEETLQQIEADLEAERQAFLKRVVMPDTREGMRRFARL